MNLPVIAFGIWLVFLTGLTFLFWLRPKSFFPGTPVESQVSGRDTVALISSLLAILLFISCFLIGVWLAIAETMGAT